MAFDDAEVRRRSCMVSLAKNQTKTKKMPCGNYSVDQRQNLGGGFKHLLCSSLFGKMIQFDGYFSKGLKPPTSKKLPSGSYSVDQRQKLLNVFFSGWFADLWEIVVVPFWMTS